MTKKQTDRRLELLTELASARRELAVARDRAEAALVAAADELTVAELREAGEWNSRQAVHAAIATARARRAMERAGH